MQPARGYRSVHCQLVGAFAGLLLLPTLTEPACRRADAARAGSVTGVVFRDADTNGRRGARESGLADWTVYLDINRDGTLSAGDRSERTGSSGTYTFAGLDRGTYAVRVVKQTGWYQTMPHPRDVTVADGRTASGIDFGYMPTQSLPRDEP